MQTEGTLGANVEKIKKEGDRLSAYAKKARRTSCICYYIISRSNMARVHSSCFSFRFNVLIHANI